LANDAAHLSTGVPAIPAGAEDDSNNADPNCLLSKSSDYVLTRIRVLPEEPFFSETSIGKKQFESKYRSTILN
jgi:hypothetical protein